MNDYPSRRVKRRGEYDRRTMTGARTRLSSRSGLPLCFALVFSFLLAVTQRSDALTWTDRGRVANVSSGLVAVTYGGGLYVAADPAGHIHTSPNGINWTDGGTVATVGYGLADVTYGADLFCGCG